MSEWTALPHLIACVIVIVVAYGLAWLMPLSARFSPLYAATIFARLLAKKVNKSANPNQQVISGALALLTYFVVLLIIIWALLFIAPADVITESVLLLISLNYFHISRTSTAIAEATIAKQTSLAKSLLAEYSFAEVKTFSQLGVIKHTMELQVLFWISGFVVPVVLFIFVGGLASLCYALLVVAQNEWHCIKPQFTNFGRAAQHIDNVFRFTFISFLLPVLVSLKGAFGVIPLYKQLRGQATNWQSSGSDLSLAVVAAGCKCEAAGPLLTKDNSGDTVKAQRTRVNKGNPTPVSCIASLQSWLMSANVVLVILIITFWVLANTIGDVL